MYLEEHIWVLKKLTDTEENVFCPKNIQIAIVFQTVPVP